MLYIKLKRSILLLTLLYLSTNCYTQIVDGNGYIIGTSVEIAIDGDGGHEGTADWPGHHSRGGSDDVPYGFVANPSLDGWVNYDGDFFTSGTPENGFGIEINGVNYSNNGWNSVSSSYYLKEIPTSPGGAITHTIEDDCITVEWEGIKAGVTINVKYHLNTGDLFYTTEVTMTNGTGSALTDLYYYRNLDPDNNESIGATFATTNTIVSQAGPDCIKALVSAEQAVPWASYLGFGALGENFRVSHGGFSNRDGSDIWNAAGGLTGTVGDVETDDIAISLAYKTDLAAGETVNFTYAVVLNSSAVEAAISSLYYIGFSAYGDEGGETTNPCNPEITVVNTCRGSDITLTINGPDTDGYIWHWFPGGEEGDVIVVSPDEEISYTVIGTPISECLDVSITKTIVIKFSLGPQIEITDPGPICGEFDLTTLEYTDGDGENVSCIFLTEKPDSANQVEPEFEGPMITEDDEVWLLCSDSTTGCYDYERIDLDFIGPGMAGPDSTISICSGPGTVIDLHIMIADTANQYGRFEELTDSDSFIDSLGLLYASSLVGTFVFHYIIDGLDPCLGDTAVFTVIIEPRPYSKFEYAFAGFSSADGFGSTCIVNEIDFINLSTIDEPGEIVGYFWDFGDGSTSTLENPSHTFLGPGTFGITLKVFSDNGCTQVSGKSIIIYEEPPFEVVYSEPTCYEYEDGVIMVVLDQNLGAIEILITDDIGTVLNVDNDSIATGLGEGTYHVDIVDVSGCSSSEIIILEHPPLLEIYLHIVHPACLGDSGHVVVDSVAGESLNNPVSYEWIPNPAGIEGFEADSSYWMVAGDYTVIVTDSKGCSNSVDFTLIDPPPFYFTEWGWDTAYCRLYTYQSGNGFVYAAAAGGLPNYVYEWTYLVDGSTSNATTWGGRNPGEHLITVTDAGGCVLRKVITVDSVNPIASFTIESAQLNENCEGTAPVEVEFTNTSQYYANPNNPIADTLFLWDMDRTEEIDWLISHSFYEKFDTTYEERGESYEIDICLIAFNKNGCSDTACKTITIFEPPALSAPNIFTPNDNNTNDLFTFDHLAKGIRDFDCIIVNRWGVTVAEFSGITAGWDGTNMGGEQCPDGVYFYVYTAVADNLTEFSGHGTVTLIGSRH